MKRTLAKWRNACEEDLESLVSSTQGVQSSAVVTGDGFEVASVFRREISGEKLAAMASSLLALSEAMTREFGMSTCRNVIVESEAGMLVALRVPVPDADLVMVVLCNVASTLGTVLFAARECAASIGDRLSVPA